MLWVFVLVKLVTPPVFSIPVLPVPEFAAGAQQSLVDLSTQQAASPDPSVLESGGLPGKSNTHAAGTTGTATWTGELTKYGPIALIVLWAIGSVSVLAWSLVRIVRFHRLLDMASNGAPARLQDAAAEIAQRLGLWTTPGIYVTSARISPMVWWIGGRVRVLIPDALVYELDDQEVRWVLAHELAHVKTT